jgi:hypothetical protein
VVSKMHLSSVRRPSRSFANNRPLTGTEWARQHPDDRKPWPVSPTAKSPAPFERRRRLATTCTSRMRRRHGASAGSASELARPASVSSIFATSIRRASRTPSP